MTRRIIQTPLAEQDVVELALYIHRNNPRAAERFLQAFDRTIVALADTPGLGTARDCPRTKGLRMWRVRGFEKYLIFYRALTDGIEVVRVLHASRNIEQLFPD
jgi:toxin ParE1/3/4